MVVQTAFSYCTHFNMLHALQSTVVRMFVWSSLEPAALGDSGFLDIFFYFYFVLLLAYQFFLPEVAIIVYIGYENLYTWNTSVASTCKIAMAAVHLTNNFHHFHHILYVFLLFFLLNTFSINVYYIMRFFNSSIDRFKNNIFFSLISFFLCVMF